MVAVFTGAELDAAGVQPTPLAPMFQRPDGSPGASPLRPALAVGVARYVGEAVAAVVAESGDAAKDALDLIEVDYEPLPAVVGAAAATAEGAPLVFPEATGNIAARMRHGDAAAAEAAFARAKHVVKLDLVNQRLAAGADGAARLRRRAARRTADRAALDADAVGRPRRARRGARRRTRNRSASSPTTSAAASA